MQDNKSKATAIKRNKISAPTRFLVTNGLVRGEVLDFGCGHGYDADTFGFDKYDPNFAAYGKLPRKTYDTVICNYVLNVIPSKEERDALLNTINTLLNEHGTAFVAVRRDKHKLNGHTSRGTYQTLIKLKLKVVHESARFCIYEKTRD